ncbi:hypothetical protein TWF192_001719 [Orbilia oligospora]|uniref:CASTOR ACT domain-containing protein n=1 Tax=Orbilia oligospora TaxID=2813651 RepID=A0A6G1LTV2_ORBOL|nr:hypothetical protein TWF679_007759 [Orbilia oligospora]KAF3210440.1 hypothetical protein TWF191_011173 [Orbilia oligospora]KAF3234000.1 hypothetical protein TWF192_001719 [Orbilia oligospora]
MPSSSPNRLSELYQWSSRSDRGSMSGSSNDGGSQPIPMSRPPMSLRKLSLRSVHGTIYETTPPASPSSFNSISAGAGSTTSSDVEWRAKRMDGSVNSTFSSVSDSTDSLRTTVRFSQDCRLSLIHIPRELYPHFLQPILKLVLPTQDSRKDENGQLPAVDEEDRYYSMTESGYQPSNGSSDVGQVFVNVSITPVECSIVCAHDTAQELFQPLLDALEPERRETVVISEDDYVVIQVDGEGFDAGQRVLELTSPLAMAGVSIFFITTYFSDYILVPARNRSNVTKALQRRGFAFEKHIDAYVTHHRAPSESQPPTPPPSITIPELQERTFNSLKQHNISPQVSRGSELLLCAGRRSTSLTPDETMHLGLVQCLINKPDFLSVTLTDTEPPSFLLERHMLRLFGPEDTLLGNKHEILIPIVLDLRDLPVESTGIVCGVAGRLCGDTGGFLERTDPVEMSYLSTARAGTVMVAEDNIDRAMSALQF